MESWVIRCLYCDYERLKDPRDAYLAAPEPVHGPDEYPWKKEAILQASAYQAPPPAYTPPRDYCCTWAPLEPSTKTFFGVDQAQGAVEPMVENSPAASVEPVQEAAPAAETSPGFYVVELIQVPLAESTLGATDCPFCYATHALFVTRDQLDRPIIRCLHCSYSRPKKYPGAIQTLAEESKSGRAFYPCPVQQPIEQAAKKTPGVEVRSVQRPIMETVKNSPAVFVDPVPDASLESKFGSIVYPKPTAQNEEARPLFDRTESADVHNLGSHPTESDRDSSSAKTETLGSQKGDRVLAVAGNSQTDRGRVLPDRPIQLVNEADLLGKEVGISQSAIAPAAKNSPGVDVDRTQEPIMETGETSPVENEQAQEWVDPEPPSREDYEFREEYDEALKEWWTATKEIGSSAAKNSPGVDVDRVPEPIVQAVENPPGIEVNNFKYYRGGREYFLIPEIPAAPEQNSAIEFEGCIYCTSPEYESWRDESYRCYRCEPESDLNPSLMVIALSDRFLARYAPPQSEIHYKPDADGQLSLLDFEINSSDEPPDPDDFETLDAFTEAMAQWDWEHPPDSFDHYSDYLPSSEDNDVSSEDKPLELSLDSFCLWAHCPANWYEPSKVMELSSVHKNSSSSDFFIPTFDRFGYRFNRSDEPPDTGIFARSPKPKPPKFPPQAASQPPVNRQGTASQSDPKLSRNYPETIPKLFHRVAAGSSTQPARSPPGGDARQGQ